MVWHTTANVLTLWDISRGGKRRGGTFFFCFNPPSWQEQHTTAGRQWVWERLLIKHMIFSVYSVISADLQDVPYIPYYVQISKRINSHEKGLLTQRFTLNLVRNQHYHVPTLLKRINRGKKIIVLLKPDFAVSVILMCH